MKRTIISIRIYSQMQLVGEGSYSEIIRVDANTCLLKNISQAPATARENGGSIQLDHMQ